MGANVFTGLLIIIEEGWREGRRGVLGERERGGGVGEARGCEMMCVCVGGGEWGGGGMCTRVRVWMRGKGSDIE